MSSPTIAGTHSGSVSASGLGEDEWLRLVQKASPQVLARALSSLDSDAQRCIERQLTTTSSSSRTNTTPCWSVRNCRMVQILAEFDLEALYAETFDECGIDSVESLCVHGRDDADDTLRGIGVTPDHRDRILSLIFSCRPIGSVSSVFRSSFLRSVQPLYRQHMGVENMAPMLYALVRFVKPSRVMEVGMGYTSVFIAAALQDNDREMEVCRRCANEEDAGYRVRNADWMVPSSLSLTSTSVLHAIDDMGAAEGVNRGSADGVSSIIAKQGLENFVQVHCGDAYDMAASICERDGEPVVFDMMWLDFGLGTSARINAFIDNLWPRLRNGGFILLHSSLTNSVTRSWLDSFRRRREEQTGGIDFDVLSFLEPHKRFQNSFTILQKRDMGYAEPIYSKWP